MTGLKTLTATLAVVTGTAISGAWAQETAQDLMKKALGTTEGVNPVLIEAIEHAAMPLTAEQRELALKCWKDSVLPLSSSPPPRAGTSSVCCAP